MQLVEDRRQTVAKENAKLMSLMNNIMNEKRSQPNYVKPSSLNENERKREVDRLNFENNLMVERLSKVHPVINKKALDESFEKHLKAESNLRRRQMKPLALPKDLHPNSPLRGRLDGNSSLSAGLFDSSLYTTQRTQHLSNTNLSSLEGAAIKSVSDFRKQVIANKKLQKDSGWADNSLVDGFQPAVFSPSSSIHVGESKMSLDSIHSSKKMTKRAGDSLYEINHIPS
jgi:hypothetical protein